MEIVEKNRKEVQFVKKFYALYPGRAQFLLVVYEETSS